jgi:predicted  nucleic acid-binding Zn-ribbon protein
MSRILLEFNNIRERYDLEVKRLSDALSHLLSSNSDGDRARNGEKALDCIFDTDEHLFNFERVMTDLISLEMTKNRVQTMTSNFISRIRSQRESLSELQKNIKNYLKVNDNSDLSETAKRNLQESSEDFKKKVLETKKESENLTSLLKDKYEKVRLGKSNYI